MPNCFRCASDAPASVLDPRLCAACADEYAAARRRLCADCGAWRLWASKSPRCGVCRAAHKDRLRLAQNERRRARYAADPVQQAAQRAQAAAWRAANPERRRATRAAYLPRQRAMRRARYATDAGYRAAQTRTVRAWRAKHPAYTSQAGKLRRLRERLRGGR